MSIENLDIVTSIQNYIAELERTANVSGGEAAEYAAEASRSGLESLPGERREKLISYCLLIAAKRVRAVTGGSAVRSDMEPCDWVNEFYICLDRVLRRFDPDRASLPTYISAAFDSFMKSYLADCDIRGRHYVASVNQLRRKREQLFMLNSCEPSDELLMKELGWGQLRLRNVRMAESGNAVIRLNDPAGEDGDATVGDTIVSDEPGVEETVENKIMLGKMRECLDSLPDDRNKAAMIRCIVHGESYGKIGEELGASKEGVRKMVNRTLKQLRTMMCA